MRMNITIAAAVAAVLGSAAAYAAGPTLATIQDTQVNHPGNVLYIAGSSAIQAALTAAIETGFCQGTFTAINPNTSVSSNNKNFFGVACTPDSTKAANPGNYNIWVRVEGGSVSGYLPIVNSSFPINFIDPAGLTADANGFPVSPTILGASTGNGTNDSFQGPLTRHIPDLGIGDVEPAALTGNNYPGAYNSAVWGPSNGAGLFGLHSSPLVDEVYALYVNTSGGHFSSPLSLSQPTIMSILNGKLKNWSLVRDTNGNPATNASVLISIVQRETGSGSRAATDILLAGDTCSGGSVGKLTTGTGAFFSTGDVLTAADAAAEGSLTYATIDNTAGNVAAHADHLALISINGVAPSNLAAAGNSYPFWVEAQFVNNATFNAHDVLAVNSIVSVLQNVNTTASLFDIDAIPGITAANGTSVNGTGLHLNPTTANGIAPTGGGTNKDGSTSLVYINAFTRSGTTCTVPTNLTTTN